MADSNIFFQAYQAGSITLVELQSAARAATSKLIANSGKSLVSWAIGGKSFNVLGMQPDDLVAALNSAVISATAVEQAGGNVTTVYSTFSGA